MIVNSFQLQKEFKREVIENLDAPEFMPAGSIICLDDGFVKRQAIWREDMQAIHPILLIYGPWPKPPKRGRPATGEAMTSAQRIRKLRAKRKAEGLCQCCGQKLPD